jgi:ferrous iron transport protein A
MVMPLGLLVRGEKGTVIDILSNCRHKRFQDYGLRIGKEVEVLNMGRPGPLLVKIDETRLAIGHGMAMKIKVMVPDKLV